MSFAKIEFDYQQALKQASKLDSIASELQRLSSRDIEEALNTLRGGWQGSSASAYIAKGRTLKDKISSTSRDLKNAAKSIRTIAKKIHDAERAAEEIAHKRSY